MLKYTMRIPGAVLPSGYVWLELHRDADSLLELLSPYGSVEGKPVPVPGAKGVSAPSVWAAFNYAKRHKSGGYTESALKDIYVTKGGVGVKPIQHAGRTVGIDRTHEEYLYRGRSVNFVQARWAILIPAYEYYLTKVVPDRVERLLERVSAAEPYDVFVYDKNPMTASMLDPMRPLSHAYLLVDIVNRLFGGHADEQRNSAADGSGRPEKPDEQRNSAADGSGRPEKPDDTGGSPDVA